MTFREYAHAVYVWESIIDSSAPKWLQKVESDKGIFNEDKFIEDQLQDDDKMIEMSKMMYQMLTKTTTGKAKLYVMNAEAPFGLKAWNELVRSFDPRTNADMMTARIKIQNPGIQAKDESQFLEIWRGWEQETCRYEMRFGEIEDVTKIVAATSMMPMNMREAVRAADKNFTKYPELKKYLTNYIRNTPLKVKKLNPQLDVHAIEGSSTPTPSLWTPSWNLGVNQSMEVQFIGDSKGKAKGGWQSKGKGSWGPGNYGKGGKGPGTIYKDSTGKGKNGSKGYGQKGGGKAGSKGLQTCYNCGGRGHIARQCPSISKWTSGVDSIDEGYDEIAENAREMNEDGCEDHNSAEDTVWSVHHGNDVMQWKRILGREDNQIANLENTRFFALTPEEDIEDGEVNNVIERKGNEVTIEFTLDSGCVDHILLEETFPEIASKVNRGGKCFFNASGAAMPNQGEKKIALYTPQGRAQGVRFQMAKVVRPLLSLGKLEDVGCEMIVKKGKSYIINAGSKEVIPVTKKHGTYKMYLKAKISETGPVFKRPGK